MIFTALINKLKLNNGIELDSAYFKVSGVSCTKEFMTFTVEVYKDKTSREIELEPVERLSYCYKHDTSENSVNSIKQAYNYLKILDEYEGAIDDYEDYSKEVIVPEEDLGEEETIIVPEEETIVTPEEDLSEQE